MTYSFAVQLCLVLAFMIKYGVRYYSVCCASIQTDSSIAEFPVADIKDIEWSDSLFNCLSIPDEQIDAIMALAETCMGKDQDFPFDDFVAGKGRGLIILLQYGPPSIVS
jgi:hypothetical protein